MTKRVVFGPLCYGVTRRSDLRDAVEGGDTVKQATSTLDKKPNFLSYFRFRGTCNLVRFLPIGPGFLAHLSRGCPLYVAQDAMKQPRYFSVCRQAAAAERWRHILRDTECHTVDALQSLPHAESWEWEHDNRVELPKHESCYHLYT